MAKYSDEQKQQALAIYEAEGPGPAHKQTGIPKTTIENWARAASLGYSKSKKPATDEQVKTLSEYRADTALRFYQVANKLLDQLEQPSHEQPALERPRYSDQKHIMTSAAIAIDKAQLLAGEATDRSGGIPAKEVVQVIDHVIATIADSDEQREQATSAVIGKLRAVS